MKPHKGQQPIRVALVGNVCNNMYNMGLALKKHTEIQPHLYLDDHMDIHTNPIYNDPEAGNQSDWVFYDKKWDPTAFYKRRDKTFINKLNAEKYDAIIVSSGGVLLAHHIKNSIFLHWTTGGDITKVPFPFAFSFTYKGFWAKIKAHIVGYIHRNALRHIDFFLSHPLPPNEMALRKLKVPPEKIAKIYFPIIIDTEIFKFNKDFRNVINAGNLEKIDRYALKIFHPSRLMVSKRKVLVESGQWKRNDLLLQGLRAFIDKYNANDVCIMLPDRKYSPDKLLFDKEIERLNLKDNIVWLHGKTDEGFDKQEMVALYSAADIVVDEFGAGWFGSIVVEGTACSKPTICYIDEEGMKKMYPWHPIISIKTENEIAEIIAKIYFDKQYALDIGNKSREWAVEFHSHEKGGEIYARHLTEILSHATNINTADR